MFCSGHVLFATCWRAYIVMGLYLLAHIMDSGFDQNKEKNKQKKHNMLYTRFGEKTL